LRVFADHLRTHYSDPNIHQRDVERVFHGLDTTGRVPTGQVPGQTIEKVAGLDLLPGWSCGLCYHFVQATSSRSGHHDKMHKGLPSNWSKVPVQFHFGAGQKIYFGVHDAVGVSEGNDAWLDVRERLEHARLKPPLIDPLIEQERFQDQFERLVRWSSEIKNKDPETLMALSSPPTEHTPLYPLKDACTKIIGEINGALSTGDRILRRKLLG